MKNKISWKCLLSSFGFSFQGTALEDFSHLPPEQRRKKLQQRIDELNRELQKESDQKYFSIKFSLPLLFLSGAILNDVFKCDV